MAEHATTGDGVLTGLHLLCRMAATGRSLADLASVIDRLPQVLINVARRRQVSGRLDEPVADRAVADARPSSAVHGRVLLRPSGTEPLVRVMVEAATSEEARSVAERLAIVVEESPRAVSLRSADAARNHRP